VTPLAKLVLLRAKIVFLVKKNKIGSFKKVLVSVKTNILKIKMENAFGLENKLTKK
jgi:hypothetical protein